jgi:cysteinyl-tRNA synthetase
MDVDSHRYIGHYVCGPTIYRIPHIGNYRTYVVAEIHSKIYGIPLYIGLTDISDKIEKLILDNYFEYTKIRKQFFKDLDDLNIRNYGVLPVSENINEIEELIKILETKEYTIQDNQGIRLKIDSRLHYALWKNNRYINWYTKYGSGQPGWHIECVANIQKILKVKGEGKIIHSGGIDLKNTHHKYEQLIFDLLGYSIDWIHIQHVCVNEHKMSKSKNNIIELRDIPIELLRFFYLTTDYNKRLDSSNRTIAQKKVEYETIVRYILTNLYKNNWIPTLLNLDYSKETLLYTGSMIRLLLKGIKRSNVLELNLFYTINKIYRIIPFKFFKIDERVKNYIVNYDLYKTKEDWSNCDITRDKLYLEYNMLYANNEVLYRGLTNPYKR